MGEIVTVSVLDGDEQMHVAFGVPPNFVGVALGVGSRRQAAMELEVSGRGQCVS